MILTGEQIGRHNLVDQPVNGSLRATSYDATVGEIILGGTVPSSETHVLPPRGIVWVISAESFNMPNDITGLATLKTTWTHEGVLALNVGVIDPGWNGPLAAALVNFGKSNFQINKGDAFFRIIFHKHDATVPRQIIKTKDEYKREIIVKSRLFSPTFLDMDSLISEVRDRVLSLPHWATIIGVAAIVVAVISVFAPIAVTTWESVQISREKIAALEKQVEELQRGQHTDETLKGMESKVEALRAGQDTNQRLLKLEERANQLVVKPPAAGPTSKPIPR